VRFRKHLLRAALIVGALACLQPGALAPPAAAATPCWKQLLNDWYDGRIDKTYKVACYRAALKHLPTDVQVYSSARDDIQRALAGALARAAKEHVKNVGNLDVTPTSYPVSSTTSTEEDTTDTTAAAGGGSGSSGGNSGTDASTQGRSNDDDGPVGVALGKASGTADSVPLPLIILGALAVLLIAAGAAGLIVRRIQARGAGPAA
jgi:hypothetical protein